ncbi:hypothetical protein L9F63_015730, partial [Diploptera punctata]
MAPSEETSSGGNSEGTSQSHDSSTSQQDSDNLPRQVLPSVDSVSSPDVNKIFADINMIKKGFLGFLRQRFK